MWSRQLATPPGPVVVAAVVGGGGGRGDDDGIDSAHHDPGVPPSLGGRTEMGGAPLLAAVVAGATADAVTFSKLRFLHKKKTIYIPRHIEWCKFITILFIIDDYTCPPSHFVFNFATITTHKHTYKPSLLWKIFSTSWSINTCVHVCTMCVCICIHTTAQRAHGTHGHTLTRNQPKFVDNMKGPLPLITYKGRYVHNKSHQTDTQRQT